MNAKDDPMYAGSLAFVQSMYRSVPHPLQNKAMDGLIPVSIGTSMVAPTIAKRCWKLSGIVLPMETLSSTSI